MSPAKKQKKFDRAAAIGFFVNFCAVFSLILMVGLLTLAGGLGGVKSGSASLSGAMSQIACSCPEAIECQAPSIAPAVLFPISASTPMEAAVEIFVDEGGFSPRELNMAISSSRTVKIINRGVREHSFLVGALGIDSGLIAPGQAVTVLLQNSNGEREIEFNSAAPGDDQDIFQGVVVFE